MSLIERSSMQKVELARMKRIADKTVAKTVDEIPDSDNCIDCYNWTGHCSARLEQDRDEDDNLISCHFDPIPKIEVRTDDRYGADPPDHRKSFIGIASKLLILLAIIPFFASCSQDLTYEDGNRDANSYMCKISFEPTDGMIDAVLTNFGIEHDFPGGHPGGKCILDTSYKNGVLDAIRQWNEPELAPSVYSPLPNTTVYSIWGSTTYHKQTCRFIAKSTKPFACGFSFPVERAVQMGLKPCRSCWK